MGNFFNNVSMTMTIHIMNVLYDLESHAKDGRRENKLQNQSFLKRSYALIDTEMQSSILIHASAYINVCLYRRFLPFELGQTLKDWSHVIAFSIKTNALNNTENGNDGPEMIWL